MKGISLIRGVVLPFVATVGLLAAPGFGQERAPLAEVKIGKDAIEWYPRVEAERLVLTVSGRGVDLRREFTPRERHVLRIEGKDGLLPDGSYNYELKAIPIVSPETRERLAEAREALDRGEKVDLSELQLLEEPMIQTGAFAVRGGAFVGEGAVEPGPTARQTGDLLVEGALKVRGEKSFLAVHPTDHDRELAYAALEGPEAGTYYRGVARTVEGRAVIELPEHFALVTEPEGLTVQLTPIGRWSRLYVEEKSLERLVVVSADGADAEFDFLVQGVRRGFADFEVERSSAGTSRADRP